jgi:hypothetical protein
VVDYVRRNGLALVAIFIALGGVAWAGARIGPGDIVNDAIRSKHIKNQQVRREDLAASAKDRCPSPATLRFGGICAGSDGVDRKFFEALHYCESLRLRLPTLGEASTLAENFDVPGVGASGLFWTDELVNSGANTEAQAVPEDGLATGTITGQIFNGPELETVCVTVPTTAG